MCLSEVTGRVSVVSPGWSSYYWPRSARSGGRSRRLIVTGPGWPGSDTLYVRSHGHSQSQGPITVAGGIWKSQTIILYSCIYMLRRIQWYLCVIRTLALGSCPIFEEYNILFFAPADNSFLMMILETIFIHQTNIHILNEKRIFILNESPRGGSTNAIQYRIFG